MNNLQFHVIELIVFGISRLHANLLLGISDIFKSFGEIASAYKKKLLKFFINLLFCQLHAAVLGASCFGGVVSLELTIVHRPTLAH